MKKLHRFIADFPLSGTEAEIDDRDFVHQVYRVLKFAPGEQMILSDGKGSDATVEIISCDDAACRVKVLGRQTLARGIKVTLYCSVLKKENFEWAAQKGVEAGAAGIVPIVTERTVKYGIKGDRLDRIIREAAEQSGNSYVAESCSPIPFSQALSDAGANSVNWFFDPSGEDFFAAACNRPAPTSMNGAVGVWIGPEGGWSEEELAAAKTAGHRVVSLGRLILRAETAAAVAVYLAAR